MNFIADAHISVAICDFLVRAGHDCIHAERISPGLSDAEILQLAVDQNRIILTSDKDFGELVFRHGFPALGVILLRFDVATESERFDLFQKYWPVIETSVSGHFVVATNRRVKRTQLPGQGNSN